MAFFKFRFPGAQSKDDVVQSAPPAESVDAVRRRARHRLIGASILVLAAVIGFPMLFDSQPRPVPVNIPIVVPDRQTTPPLALPAAKAEKADKEDSPTVAASDALGPKEQVVAAAGAATAVAAATNAIKKIAPDASKANEQDAAAKAAAQKAEADAKRAADEKAKAKAKAESDAKAKAKALKEKQDKQKAEEAAKAKAALEDDKPAPTKPEKTEKADKADKAEGRFIVQAGTFDDVTKARAARRKVEAAGIKTYTQVITSSDGKQHIRVRVGPYPTKAEAEKAASKLKSLKLEAGIYQL